MESRIEQLIGDLEEYIESCKPKFMSSTEIIVNKDEIDDRLHDLRRKIPEEITWHRKIINNRDAILADAQNKAKALIEEATVHTNELVSEHEIMRQAYERANGIVDTAANQAQEILDKATMEANDLRMQASRYIEERLAELEAITRSAIQATQSHYGKLISSLEQHHSLIEANIRALEPVDEYLEQPPMDEGMEEQG
mgnify:CR=1 FL=1|jgi:cell division septum initiation protein DivIVA